YDCAGWRDITRRDALGALQARLSATGAGAFPPVPAAVPGGAGRYPRGGPTGILWRDQGPGSVRGLHRASRAAQERELVRLRQAALRQFFIMHASIILWKI